MSLRKCSWCTLAAIGAFLLSGCLARQVARDGKSFRQALLDMYTDQVMDNLVRARENLPFVQVAYSNLVVQDTDTLHADGSTGQTAETNGALNIAGEIMTTAARNFQRTFSVAGSAERAMQMSFNADPVTNQNDIYEAYLAFANDPTFLIVSHKKPHFPVHIMRKCGHKYYWVPAEAGSAFLELVLKTTFMRGPETAPPSAYEVTITAIPEIKKEDGNIYATLEFDKPVPNGNATMVVVLEDGRKIRQPLRRLLEKRKGDEPPPPLGRPTVQLKAAWNSISEGFTEHNLIGRPARIYSEYPPEVPAPRSNVQPIVNELERIRLNQNLRRPL